MEIIEEMKGSSDGFFDCFLFWLLFGYIYNGKYVFSIWIIVIYWKKCEVY